MRRSVWSDVRPCLFANAEKVEVIAKDWKVIE